MGRLGLVLMIGSLSCLEASGSSFINLMKKAESIAFALPPPPPACTFAPPADDLVDLKTKIKEQGAAGTKYEDAQADALANVAKDCTNESQAVNMACTNALSAKAAAATAQKLVFVKEILANAAKCKSVKVVSIPPPPNDCQTKATEVENACKELIALGNAAIAELERTRGELNQNAGLAQQLGQGLGLLNPQQENRNPSLDQSTGLVGDKKSSALVRLGEQGTSRSPEGINLSQSPAKDSDAGAGGDEDLVTMANASRSGVGPGLNVDGARSAPGSKNDLGAGSGSFADLGGMSGPSGAKSASSKKENAPNSANAPAEYGGGSQGKSTGGASRLSSLGLKPGLDAFDKLFGKEEKPKTQGLGPEPHKNRTPASAGKDVLADPEETLFKVVGDKIREFKHARHLLL